MSEFILLMHDDAPTDDEAWAPYIRGLQQRGCFEGGSVIGDGIAARKRGTPAPLSTQIAGYIRVTAGSLEAAKALLAGNPAYEAGATVEIRELPRSD
ncbi:MAG TPA: hypothetical protein VFB45_07205 [Pseudolabrys sp.]|nr:hypothetical protein [Pseudolabrys sp.]